jgi:hypothetical protein
MAAAQKKATFQTADPFTHWELVCRMKTVQKQAKGQFRKLLAESANGNRKSCMEWDQVSLSESGFVAVFKTPGLSRTNAHAWLYRNFNHILKGEVWTWDPVADAASDLATADGATTQPEPGVAEASGSPAAAAAAEASGRPAAAAAAEASGSAAAAAAADAATPPQPVAQPDTSAPPAPFPGSVSLKLCGHPHPK